MVYACDLCHVKVSSTAMFDGHIQSHKHIARVNQQKNLQQIVERSVFLSKFTSPIDVHLIEQTLKRFGELDRVIMDKQNPSFAIVEFKEPQTAQYLIHSLGTAEIGNNNVKILPRRINFNIKKNVHIIDSNDVIQCLKSGGLSFTEQVDVLISNFVITQSMISERKLFIEELKNFMQPYLSFPICIRIFGSTATTTALIGSDLVYNPFHFVIVLKFKDINFKFNDDDSLELNNHCLFNGGSSPTSSVSSNSSTQRQDIEISQKPSPTQPISRETFISMKKADRSKLLNRIINIFRKETGLINDLVSVLDARCPVIKFSIRKMDTFCEMSIENTLGELKANFVRDVFEADSSGNLRRFIILLKLWAHVNGLFHDENSISKANWNSYTLSLLAISFFQTLNRIPPINFQGHGKHVNGWPVEYLIQSFDLSDLTASFSTTFKNLLTFLHETINESRVHSVRNCSIYSISQFKQSVEVDERIHGKWRFSLVNVQDPIELSHNIAANVSKHFVQN